MSLDKGLAGASLAALAVLGAWELWSAGRQEERDTHLLRRPWVIFERATDDKGAMRLFPGDRGTVLVWVKNNGNTPALDVASEACPFFGATAPALDTRCPATERPRFTLEPRRETALRVEDVTVADRAAFDSGAATLWMLASVEYGDAFGHRHRNRFCFRWARDRGQFVSCAVAPQYD